MESRAEIRSRLLVFSEEIERLLQSEFPYRDAQDAFMRLNGRTQLRLIEEERMGLSPAPRTVAAVRVETLQFLNYGIKAAGRILRSTNVRNPLELHRPLRRLAEHLLGAQAPGKLRGLLLASEWVYAPHSVSSDPSLPGFIIIGFPAHESFNALLIPLAGHELGHTLLRWSDVIPALTGIVEEKVSIAADSLLPTSGQSTPPERGVSIRQKTGRDRLAAVNVATRYASELFCDFIALGIFGSAYLRAFAYLFAPGGRVVRSDSHPATEGRARHMVDAATAWGIPVPATFLSRFSDSPESGEIEPLEGIWTRVVDEALRQAASAIRDVAKRELDRAPISPPAEATEVGVIAARFRLGVPVEGATGLAPILVAAWEAHEAPNERLPMGLPMEARTSFLNDLTLKSVEILDYEQTLAKARARREAAKNART